LRKSFVHFFHSQKPGAKRGPSQTQVYWITVFSEWTILFLCYLFKLLGIFKLWTQNKKLK